MSSVQLDIRTLSDRLVEVVRDFILSGVIPSEEPIRQDAELPLVAGEGGAGGGHAGGEQVRQAAAGLGTVWQRRLAAASVPVLSTSTDSRGRSSRARFA